MGEALAEARTRWRMGERPIAAVAVVDEAMVARAHDRVQESNDPTAHAVVVALREAARKLGKDRLGQRHDLRDARALRDVCRGAPRERRRDARLRRPEPRGRRRRNSHPARPAPRAQRRLKIVSGIRRDEAEELFAAAGAAAPASSGRPDASGPIAATFGILSRGEVSEWLMVPLSKSGVRKHRGFESRPLRQLRTPRGRRCGRWTLRSSDLGPMRRDSAFDLCGRLPVLTEVAGTLSRGEVA